MLCVFLHPLPLLLLPRRWLNQTQRVAIILLPDPNSTFKPLLANPLIAHSPHVYGDGEHAISCVSELVLSSNIKECAACHVPLTAQALDT